MAVGKFVSYLRVSTDRQGQSGLGLEAQRDSVAGYLNGGEWELLEEFVEVESGKRNNRPELAHALASCRIHRATLVVARLDRLARNAHFLLGLAEAGVDFVAVDMPFANRLTIGVMALVAEETGRSISAVTKSALQAAKARGVKLGSPRPITRLAQVNGNRESAVARKKAAAKWIEDIGPVVEKLMMQHQTLFGTAKALNAANIPARMGGMWQHNQVRQVLMAMKQ